MNRMIALFPCSNGVGDDARSPSLIMLKAQLQQFSHAYNHALKAWYLVK